MQRQKEDHKSGMQLNEEEIKVEREKRRNRILNISFML